MKSEKISGTRSQLVSEKKREEREERKRQKRGREGKQSKQASLRTTDQVK